MSHNTTTTILVHSSNKPIDQDFSVPVVSTLNVMPSLLSEPSVSTAQLERPQVVVGLLKARPNSENLMDKVLNADDVVLPKGLQHKQETVKSIICTLYNSHFQ